MRSFEFMGRIYSESEVDIVLMKSLVMLFIFEFFQSNIRVLGPFRHMLLASEVQLEQVLPRAICVTHFTVPSLFFPFPHEFLAV